MAIGYMKARLDEEKHKTAQLAWESTVLKFIAFHHIALRPPPRTEPVYRPVYIDDFTHLGISNTITSFLSHDAVQLIQAAGEREELYRKINCRLLLL